MKTPAHAMMALLFPRFLVASAQCRPEARKRRSYSESGGGTDTTTKISVRAPLMSSNSTAVEEEKLYVKFCTHRGCEIDGKIYNECGCCELLPPYPLCFKSTDLCKVWCPACHPHCPHTPPLPLPPPPPPSPPPPPTPPPPPPDMP